MSEFHLLRPLWLLALPPLAWLLWRLARRDGDAEVWRRVVDPHLLPSLLHGGDAALRRGALWLLGAGWLFAVIALAGPTWQRLPEPLFEARQYRVIVLDLSATMNATDVRPSRLAQARYEVLDLLAQSREGQTALLAYGSEPFVVAPLTADAATIAAQIPHLETNLLPVGGARRTDLALDAAGALLRQATAVAGQVILVTDGLDHPAAADEAARRLHAAGYEVSVIGVGTPKGGPVQGPDGSLLKDPGGAIRLADFAVDRLQALADAGGGRFVVSVPGDADIARLAPGRADLVDDEAGDRQTADRWREEGPWLLLLLLPLAALAFRRGWVSPLLVLLVLLPPPDAAYAATGDGDRWEALWRRPDQRAAALLEQGRADEAAAVFERPDWRAAAHYRADDYAGSLQALEGQQGATADYNRGNALARLGRLDEALGAYDAALAARPDDADARHNRALVQRLLDQQRAAQDRQQQGQPNNSTSAGQRGGDQDADRSQAGGQQGSDGAESSQDAQADASAAGQTGDGDASTKSPASSGQGDEADAQSQQGRTGAANPPGQGDEDAASTAQGEPGQGDAAGSDAQPAGGESAQGIVPSQAGQQAGQAGAQRSAAAEKSGAQDDTAARSDQNRDATGTAQSGEQGGAAAQASAGEPGGAGADGAKQEEGRQPSQGRAPAPTTADNRRPEAFQGAAPGAGAHTPGESDLLGDTPPLAGRAEGAGIPAVDPEDRQAIEQILRRVDDDPAGLLRQRFLLQHLRRSGQLP